MKRTLYIPDGTMKEAMRLRGEKIKRKAVMISKKRVNRLKRLGKLNARVRGQFRDFMSRADLKAMRAADMPKSR
jgi:hypothetical protein